MKTTSRFEGIEAVEAIGSVDEAEDYRRRIFLPFTHSAYKSLGLYVAVQKISDDLGLLDELLGTFKDYEAFLILDLAMYLMTCDKADPDLKCFPTWVKDHRIFSHMSIVRPVDKDTSEELTRFFTDRGEIRLLREIEPSHIKHFKTVWNRKAANLKSSPTSPAGEHDEADMADETERLLTINFEPEYDEFIIAPSPINKLTPMNDFLYFIASILYSALFERTVTVRKKLLPEELRYFGLDKNDMNSANMPAILSELNAHRIMHVIIGELERIACLADFEKFEKAVKAYQAKPSWRGRMIPTKYNWSDKITYRQKEILREIGVTQSELTEERKRLDTCCDIDEVVFE